MVAWFDIILQEYLAKGCSGSKGIQLKSIEDSPDKIFKKSALCARTLKLEHRI